jgi:hypothetical protein
MTIALGHPVSGREMTSQGEILRGGGTAVGRQDQLGVPTAGFVWTGTLWVPMSGTAAGHINVVVPAGITEPNSLGIWDVLRNLFTEMQGEHRTIQEVQTEIRKLTEAGSALSASRIPVDGRLAPDGTPVTARGLQQGVPFIHNLGAVAFDVNRKYVGTDAGAYVSPAAPAAANAPNSMVTFTGVNLVGRVYVLYNVTDHTYHLVTAAVDPAGGAVGTLTVVPAIPSANAVLRIPFASVPHGYNTAADAIQGLSVNPSQNHLNGPAEALSITADLANGTTQYFIPCLGYGRVGIEFIWTANAASVRTLSFHIFGKITDAAWAGIGAIPAAQNCENMFQLTTGSTAWGAAAASGRIVGRTQDPVPFRELCVEMTVLLDDNPKTTTVDLWYDLYGGAR